MRRHSCRERQAVRQYIDTAFADVIGIDIIEATEDPKLQKTLR